MSKCKVYDVAVLGAGIVGCATARELTRRGARVVILEKEKHQLETQASLTRYAATWSQSLYAVAKGFDVKPDTLEGRLVRRGWELWHELREVVPLPEKRNGGLLVAWTKDEALRLPVIQERAAINGVITKILTSKEVYAHEPSLAPGAEGGLYVPGEGVVEPWLVGSFYLRSALARRADLRCSFEVLSAELDSKAGVWRLQSARGDVVHAALAVNCAGNQGDVLSSILGLLPTFTITPRKGQFVVFQPATLHRLRHVVLPVPTERTKGVLLFPTLSGHVVCGPTADDVSDRTSPPRVDASVTKELMSKAEALMPELARASIVLTYAGLRPATEHQDYQVAIDVAKRVITLGGIRSTGLSAALGIAEYAADLVAQNWPFVSARTPKLKLEAHTEKRVYIGLVKRIANKEKQPPNSPHPLSALNLHPTSRLIARL